MASFNRVILAGNLTRDPQLSYLPSNTAVCDFGLAVNRKFRDKDGNQREEVSYVDLAAYGRQAEVINQYFQKGKPILIEGRLRYRDWVSKEGQKRNKLDVLVESFTFIDSGGGGGGGGPRGGQAPQGGGYGGSQGRPRPSGPSGSSGEGGYSGQSGYSAQGEPDMPPPMDDEPPPAEADIPF